MARLKPNIVLPIHAMQQAAILFHQNPNPIAIWHRTLHASYLRATHPLDYTSNVQHRVKKPQRVTPNWHCALPQEYNIAQRVLAGLHLRHIDPNPSLKTTL